MKSLNKNQSIWPPDDGKEFIQSDVFGQMIISLVELLTRDNPRMDFTDASAITFEWFDKKLSEDIKFINRKRFPTINAFKAYVRQALWRCALLAERQRLKHKELISRMTEQQQISSPVTPEELSILHEAIMTLPELHRTVFIRVFLDEEDYSFIADSLNLDQQNLIKLYEDAVDLLEARLFP